MKQAFTEPVVKIARFEVQDVITTSSDSTPPAETLPNAFPDDI